MARLPALALVLALALAGAGCSDDAPETVDEPATTVAPGDPPVELFVTEDHVRVGLTGIYGDDGSVLLLFDGGQGACVRGAVDDELALDGGPVAAPGTVDDPDDEQLVAEAVVSCVAFDRLRDHVRSQLADQPALEGVDPSCLDREIDALRSQPDVLAAVLQGDENGRPAVAGTIAENCAT